jgi:hypothetical protein
MWKLGDVEKMLGGKPAKFKEPKIEQMFKSPEIKAKRMFKEPKIDVPEFKFPKFEFKRRKSKVKLPAEFVFDPWGKPKKKRKR